MVPVAARRIICMVAVAATLDLPATLFADPLEKARTALAEGRHGAALVILSGSASLAKADYRQGSAVSLLRGQAYLGLGKRNKALEALLDATQLDPENMEAADLMFRVESGEDLLDKEQERLASIHEALEAIESASDYGARTGPALRPTLSKTRVVFDQALAQGVAPALAHLGLGRCLSLSGGDRERAEIQLNKALTLDPQNPQTFLAMARHHVRSGHSFEASQVLRTSYKTGHRDVETCFALAATLGAGGRKRDRGLALDCLKMVAHTDADAGRDLLNSFRRRSWRKSGQKAVDVANREEQAMQRAKFSGQVLTQGRSTRRAWRQRSKALGSRLDHRKALARGSRSRAARQRTHAARRQAHAARLRARAARTSRRKTRNTAGVGRYTR